MSARAQALVLLAGVAHARALGAARRVGADIEIEARPGRVQLVVTAKDGAAALALASKAALALVEALGDEAASIELKRLAGAKGLEREVVSARGRPRPQTLMDEVSSPRPGPDNRREAFRAFMTGKRLRPTTWAKDAGVSSGEILGYLTGRSRGFSPEVAEKLARAAKARVEDMFRSVGP